MSEGTKAKINQVVKDYERIFPAEFEAFKKGMSQKIDIRANKFGELKKTDFVVRKLVEWPETLFNLIQSLLTSEELKELFDDPKGLEWFAKEHGVYRYAEKV